MARKENPERNAKGGAHEVIGISLFFLAVLFLLSLISYDPADLPFNGTEVNETRSNLVGLAGAWLGQACFLVLGLAAYLLAPLMFLFALVFVFEWPAAIYRRWPWAVALVMFAAAGMAVHPGLFSGATTHLNTPSAGGYLGWALNQYVFTHVGTVGATVLLLAVYFICVLFLSNFRLAEWARNGWRQWRTRRAGANPTLTGKEQELEEQAKELETQLKQLKQKLDDTGAEPSDKEHLGADLQPVPEPQVRDLSLPPTGKPEKAAERKLAAIMFTDLAGFSKLSRRDEKTALKLLKKQRALLRPIVEEFEGEWLKELGDGLLLSFPSSLSAAQCALRLQEAARGVAHLDLRIGIHQGDIVREGDDIFGDGVNIASRLEKFAPVGGVVVSQKIHQDISSYPEFDLKLLGEFELEGVEQSIELFTIASTLTAPLEETRLDEPEEDESPKSLDKTPATKEDILPPKEQLRKKKPKPLAVAQAPIIGDYKKPSLDFLPTPEPSKAPQETREDLLANAKLMQQTLAQFGIEVALGDITKGPTITRYELHPAPGVKLEKITALTNNIAAALRAERIHILAPVPGKSSVGVEVPNRSKTKVVMRDLLESARWAKSKARVPVALGKDVYGKPIIADLAEMPHLLIAGATGAGKSVCINSIIASLLYRFSPDELRFVMIDPKVVELQVYNALPHLVVPVVTDPKKVVLALRWVVQEMEKRYKIFARAGVKNIQGFNGRSPAKDTPESEPELPLFGGERIEANSDGFAVEVDEDIMVPRDDDIEIPDKLSYIVVVIDELADLMLAAPADVETAIVRITQMARAAGIHCIVATQRPSVDVITGVIKANIPARIAFQVASKIDSRTILDGMGAEKLLGKGDMLYLKPSAAQPMRAQGALVTDAEIQQIVDFIAKQGSPAYEMEIHEQLNRPTASYETGASGEDEGLIQQSIEVIRSEHKASVSLLQRRLRLGYTRAARIMDELEDRGIVGPSKGAEPRDILIDLDAHEPAVH